MVGVDSTSTEMTLDSVETCVVAPVVKENSDSLTPAMTIPMEDGNIPIGIELETTVSLPDVPGADASGANRLPGLKEPTFTTKRTPVPMNMLATA